MGIENQLFTWEKWEEVETMSLQFYEVVLKVQIGEFPVGTAFGCAVFDCNANLLQLFDEKKRTCYEFPLVVSVGPLSQTVDTQEGIVIPKE
jgi:hypothetical protein